MIAVERRDGCVVLRLQRPEVGNAFNDELIARLLDVLDDLRHDARLRALVLTGSGKIFSAGADLNWMKRMQQASRAENLRDAERTALLFARLYDFSAPGDRCRQRSCPGWWRRAGSGERLCSGVTSGELRVFGSSPGHHSSAHLTIRVEEDGREPSAPPVLDRRDLYG